MRFSAATTGSAAKKRWPLVALSLFAFFSCIVSPAWAGLATTNFALNDGFGPDGGRWRGSVAIDVNPVGGPGGNEVEAVVEWAAFFTGKFQQYLDAEYGLGIATDPSAPGEITYAYQVVSVAAASPGISTLTVGVDHAAGAPPVDPRGTVAPTFVAMTGGVAPSGSSDQGTSMLWNWGPGDALLNAGETSPILVFTSPFAPEFDTMQLSSGLASPDPSPLVASIGDRIVDHEVPEPAALVLLALSGTTLLATRRLRQ
jgi:hypothetical protein